MSKKTKKKNKKKYKYRRWIGDDSYDDFDYDVDDEPTSPIQKYVERFVKAVQTDIPQHLRLNSREAGFVFGAEKGNCNGGFIGIQKGTEGNIAIFGANGSGKSRHLIKPSLTKFGGSIVATDIKGELSEYYIEHAEPGVNKPCYVFDPTDPDTICYDPFGSIDGNDDSLISIVKEIALIIIPERHNNTDTFWENSERMIFIAALIHYYRLGLSFMQALCKITSSGVASLYADMNDSGDALVKSFLGEFGKLKNEVKADIDFGLRGKITPIATDPYISNAFRGSREGAKCFSGKDLENYNIFIRVPGDKIEQWAKPINIIYTQLIHYLERRPEKYSNEGAKIEPTLIIMDEFARFGKLDAIIPAVSTLRSKGVNICIVLQSLAQIDMIYSQDARRVILDNCQYQAILSANDAETQQLLSERIGTVKRLQDSISEHYDDIDDKSGYSEQISNTRELLVQPHELAVMKDIMLLTPYGNFRIDKIPPESTLRIEKESSDTYRNAQIGCTTLCSNNSKYVVVQARVISCDEKSDGIVVPARAVEIDEKPEVIQDTTETEKGGTKMLTYNERVSIANRIAGLAEYQRKTAQLDENKTATELDSWQYSVIGKIVCKYIPEFSEIDINGREDGNLSVDDVRNFFRCLTDDKALIDDLKRKADIDYLEPLSADV